MAKKSASMSFEEALSEMESIIGRLEGENLPLQEALSQFERGVALMRICDGHLQTAEGTLKELTKGENGEMIERILGTMPESMSGEDGDDA